VRQPDGTALRAPRRHRGSVGTRRPSAGSSAGCRWATLPSRARA